MVISRFSYRLLQIFFFLSFSQRFSAIFFFLDDVQFAREKNRKVELWLIFINFDLFRFHVRVCTYLRLVRQQEIIPYFFLTWALSRAFKTVSDIYIYTDSATFTIQFFYQRGSVLFCKKYSNFHILYTVRWTSKRILISD